LTVNGLSGKKRILVYDETNKLVPILAHYNAELDFLRLDDLEELDRTPSEMVILNLIEPERLIASMQKAKHSSSFTPVVGVSFSSFLSDPPKAGVVAYLVKPFKYDLFLAAFKQIKTPVKKVLIVDDDPDIRQLLTRMLLTAGDYEIIYAESGEKALDALQTTLPDVMLLDIVLGDMDGWQVLEQKNTYPDQCGIPVIIISGRDLIEFNMRTAIIAATYSEGLTVRQCLLSALDFSAELFNEGSPRSPTPG
jgi:CheY-like chemotaxis protein